MDCCPTSTTASRTMVRMTLFSEVDWSAEERVRPSISLLRHCPAMTSEVLATLADVRRRLKPVTSSRASSPLVRHICVWCVATIMKRGHSESCCRKAVMVVVDRVSSASALASTLLAPDSMNETLRCPFCSRLPSAAATEAVSTEKNSAL